MELKFLENTGLFRGIGQKEALALLQECRAGERTYSKGQQILRAGEPVRALGLVLRGAVRIETCDAWGNAGVLDHVGRGQVFAETYACLPETPLLVDVVAAEACAVLFLEVRSLLRGPAQGPGAVLLRNLLEAGMEKNLRLSRRIFHTSAKTIRGRLLSYLSFQAIEQGSKDFFVPFNRQQLADYLGVDRSALSHELGKMKAEGLIECCRSHVRLLTPDN